MKRGDRVRVRRDHSDDWCEAEVALVSENGVSVGLVLSGMVRAGDGFIAGVLPLIVDFRLQRITGLTGDEYEIEIDTSSNLSP